MLLKLPFNRKICNHFFFKSRCISELFWKFLKNTNVQVLFFFPKAPDMFLKSSHVQKHLDYIMIICFYLVCFTFSILYSVLPFQLVYIFHFLHLFFYFCYFSSLYQHSRKTFVYIYISSMHSIYNMYIIYILKNLQISAYLKYLRYFYSTCLTQYEYNARFLIKNRYAASNKGLLYGTQTYIQYLIITYNGK